LPVRKVRFLAAARAEYVAETNRYKNIQPSLGSQFAEAVARTLALVLAFPQAGAPFDDDMRNSTGQYIEMAPWLSCGVSAILADTQRRISLL
jgi:hypothetical protein